MIKHSWSEMEWLRERLRDGLELLLLAHQYAELDDSAVELLAIKYVDLRDGGMVECDMQWLLGQSLLIHHIEITLPGDEQREFRPGGAAVGTRSCFTLSSDGLAFAKSILFSGQSENPTTPHSGALPSTKMRAGRSRPIWDPLRQELSYHDVLVKRFRLPSPNQTAILSAFEEEDWPARIDDPLPPKAEQDPKRRLHDTIRNLNRSHRKQLLRFSGDGSGQGVIWEPAS